MKELVEQWERDAKLARKKFVEATTVHMREIVARLALESADALTVYYASHDIDREALATYEALRFVLDTVLRAHAMHEAGLVDCPASFLRKTDILPAIGREFAARLRLLALADEIDGATASERTSESKAFVISTKMSGGAMYFTGCSHSDIEVGLVDRWQWSEFKSAAHRFKTREDASEKLSKHWLGHRFTIEEVPERISEEAR